MPFAIKVSRKIHVISSTLGDVQPNAATKCGGQVQDPKGAPQRAPYKMQNPELRSSRNRNFGNNMEALQNAEPSVFFIHKKNGFGRKCMAQEDLSVENIGPNLFSTKPGLTYFLEEIQTPI
jgi:hypothetical protein